jgi:predicted ABC-type sugar transport system permease subunit
MNIALHLRRYGTLTGFALMVIFFAVNLPETFLTSRNLLNVSQQISMLAVVAFTMTVVMSMGDFDLSVGRWPRSRASWLRRFSWRAGRCPGPSRRRLPWASRGAS